MHPRLCPGHEAIVIARKKTDYKSYTDIVATWGTGGLRTKNTVGEGKMSTTVFAYNKPTDWEREPGAGALPLRRVSQKPRTGNYAKALASSNSMPFTTIAAPCGALLTIGATAKRLPIAPLRFCVRLCDHPGWNS